MLENFQSPARAIFFGNLLLVLCCVFYLAWWFLAFRVNNPIKGIQSGWLLIPAAVAGLSAVVLTIQGITATKAESALVPSHVFLWGGAIAFVILAVITVVVFKRQMTSELLLFVFWGALALAEVNVLYGSQQLSSVAALVLTLIVVLVVAASLVCYVLFYRLEPRLAFWDGAIPLLLIALTMAALSVCLVAHLR
ncbi:MAG: hypothetical protein FWF45_02520 [Coriobacteriia bacterium]|nr:hypothetical protein [Coriobacteriia bacterium]